MRKCVVLLSGGLDSTTALAIAKSEGFEPYALTVLYGQRHEVEVEAARRVGVALAVSDHKFVTVGLRQFGGSSLTSEVDVPKDRTAHDLTEGIPSTYVPARNTILLALALAYAETIGAFDIVIGVNTQDYSGYPDCRPEFVEAFENLANLATRAGSQGAQFLIHTPLSNMSKVEIIGKGMELGVDFGMTHSCYDPDESGHPCGRCDACLIRQRAFAELGMKDPATVDG